MVNRATKLRWRRRIKRGQRQVEDVGAQADAGLEQHFFRRLGRLIRVRRFVVSWLLLMALLILGSVVQLRGLSQYYQELEPAPGGAFTEGVIGVFSGANPLYASGAADSSVAKLVFSGLMQYDTDNNLVNDLAEDIKADERGARYEVKLRTDAVWHDGEPVTAEDVVFTYRTIQNPDARSQLFESWRGVKISAKDNSTIVFELPNALASFPHSLTNGIVPKHILEDIAPDQLRSARFNTVEPVGSGPFKWDALEVVGASQEEREERIGLMPNEDYYKGQPSLNRFIIRTFRDTPPMLKAYKAGELNGMVGLNSTAEELESAPGLIEHNVPLAGQVMAFFNTTEAPLNDVYVRRSLVQAVNVASAVKSLDYPAIVTRAPLLTSQLGYDRERTQLPYDTTGAQSRLDQAGWRKGSDGIRQKDGNRLSITLQAQNTADYIAITGYLQEAWLDIGVEVEVLLQTDGEIRSAVQRHGYQVILYGISVGPDPDVFAYWHSSQADPNSTRLNLSDYKSSKADAALEEGRIRTDSTARIPRYRDFLDAWRADAPALALYQPRFLYITRGPIFNFAPKLLNSSTDRYADIENWMIREEKTVK